MEAHRIETTVTHDGALILDNLPFQVGDVVEITIRLQRPAAQDQPFYTLRGAPLRYEQPMQPVADT